MIDNYGFGRIVINGKAYTSDVIIYPDRIREWWRREGHTLLPQDLTEVFEFDPDILIVGTGSPGYMRVPRETIDHIRAKGIRLIIENTEMACEQYNDLKDPGKVVAALHLTC